MYICINMYIRNHKYFNGNQLKFNNLKDFGYTDIMEIPTRPPVHVYTF